MSVSITGFEGSINFLGLQDCKSYSPSKLILPRTHEGWGKDPSPGEPLMGTPGLADTLIITLPQQMTQRSRVQIPDAQVL